MSKNILRSIIVSVLFSVILMVSFWSFGTKKEVTVNENDLREAPATGAKLSLGYIGDARSYPNNQIPEAGFLKAFERAKKFSKASISPEWEPMGPTNVGGRTLALAINPLNPEIVFAGSASGGLWKSTTGGSGLNAWNIIKTGFPVLGVGAIAIDPQDPNTMFIGTGENYGSPESYPGIGFERTTRGSYGIGILRSNDGGLTWGKSLDWALNQRTAVQKIQVNPMRSNSIWAATTEGTFRSRDGGDSWEKVHDIRMATDIIINPSDTSIIYVANGGMGSLGNGIYRSKNSGTSFEKMSMISGGGPSNYQGKAVLDISLSNPNIVMASIGNSDGTISDSELNGTWLMRSENGGDNWELKSTTDYSSFQGWYAHSIAINPVDPNTVWAVGQPFSILKSVSEGANLQENINVSTNPPGLGDPDDVYPFLSSWADFHDIVFHPTNPEIIYFINDGGIFRTTNGGSTFENCNSGYQTTQFYNGVSNSNTTGNLILGGLQDNSSVIYEGDKNWRRAWAGDGAWTALDQLNNNNAYLSAQFGQAVFSNNLFSRPPFFGNSFRPTFEQIPQSETNFITPMILSPADNSTFYMAGEVVYTAFKGNNVWSFLGNGVSLDGNAMTVMAGSHQDAKVLYVGSIPKSFDSNRGHLYRTDDKGVVWNDITKDLPDRFPTDLVVDPNNDRRVFVTFGGFGTSHVFKSENGGNSWEDIGIGLPDIPTWSVTVDPEASNHIYVGNEIGVFQSIDGGINWENISGNLPDAIFAMDLFISQSNRKLRVATHGNGVYEVDLDQLISANETGFEKPLEFELKQNYPNPFNPSTNISYGVATSGEVTLEVFDITGRHIKTLINENQNQGNYSVTFDGSGLSSGTYIYRLQVGSKVISKKMLLVK